VGIDVKADLRRLRPHLVESSSRRTSFASRSAKGIDNPLDEVRKRLASLEPPSRADLAVLNALPNPTPSESGLSASVDMSSATRGSRKGRLEGKAAPAIGRSNTIATGLTTIHDEPSSGRSTPFAGGMQPSTGQAAPYSSSYEGQDPGVRAFLEQVDLDNYREPLLYLGPRILASQRKRSARTKSTTPQGVTMIAHLTHHTSAITGIITSPDQVFFATCAEDCQVLIWDTARLERSVSTKPRLVYTMDAPVTSMCRVENTHCIVVAAEDGQLHVLRVHVATGGGSAKYSKIECIRTWRTEETDGHVVSVSHLTG
jgi:phosphoinositide-3-kinase regulatory subunit 4